MARGDPPRAGQGLAAGKRRSVLRGGGHLARPRRARGPRPDRPAGLSPRVAPRVSVLLPVRDAEGTLGACLASLAAQTLADHEVIAVDDGSRDGSRAILEAFARSDPRLSVLAPGRRGLVAALAATVRVAR